MVDVIPQRGLVCFMFANLTGRGTSLVQGSGTFCVPKKVQLCDRLLLHPIFVFMKTLLLEALTRIPQVSSKPAENVRIETQRARGKRHLHHFRNSCVFFGKYASKRSRINRDVTAGRCTFREKNREATSSTTRQRRRGYRDAETET